MVNPPTLRYIAVIRSTIKKRGTGPRQGDEGAPDAWLELDADVADGMRDLRSGDEILVLTWLDRTRRDVLLVHPRRRVDQPPVGVFSTRSPDRPNPIGLHQVTVLAVEGRRVRVNQLEALDGTPIVDIKPVLRRLDER